MSSSHLALLEVGYWRELAKFQRMLVHDIGNLQVGYQFAQQKVADLDGKMLAIDAHLRAGFPDLTQQPSMVEIADAMHELRSKYNQPVSEVLFENGPRLKALLAMQGLFALYDEPLQKEPFSLAEVFTPLHGYFAEQCVKQRMQIRQSGAVEAVVEASPGALALTAVAMMQLVMSKARSQSTGKDKPYIEFRYALALQEETTREWLVLEAMCSSDPVERDSDVMVQQDAWQTAAEVVAALGADLNDDLQWALAWLQLAGGGAKAFAMTSGQGLICGLPVMRLS